MENFIRNDIWIFIKILENLYSSLLNTCFLEKKAKPCSKTTEAEQLGCGLIFNK